ncbi:MAG: hypothetical protein IE927_06930 [Rhodobacterales bacterium]|nr:hypothetical protein [Rhodobacterales bacterium]
MTNRRWIKSAIAAANDPVPALPFQRGSRRKPAALKPAAAAPAPRPRALAAR